MKKIILSGILLGIAISCSEQKKCVRKGAIAVDQCDFEKAISYYDQLISKDNDSYFGNAGKGIVLSEYMEKHEEAIPYLEKALKNTPEKTAFKINYDLGKSYHRIGNYNRALYFYAKAVPYNKDDNSDYDIYLVKRIADCKYALAHTEIAPQGLQSVKNVGWPINTGSPEYGPVYVGGRMIFTSQRKDSPKEKKSIANGNYYESMYISYFEQGNFTIPKRFTLPDYRKNSKFLKHNESVLSGSEDGKKLFIYRDGNIYEANVYDTTRKADKLNKNINLSDFQCHANLCSNGKTLFFTSESEKGVGGTDIYKSEKDNNGNWSKPNLLNGVNTVFNEDSPYLSEDGTLYFSSNGLPGYGGYDVYKTRYENGQWTTPENLGQPINSAGDDLYFALKPTSSYGYYASSRVGGVGDMDIYNVHYVSAVIPECKTITDSIFAVNITPNPLKKLTYQLSIQVPEEYSKSEKSYTWKINDEILTESVTSFDHTFNNPGTYTVSAKVVVYCDTCPSMIALCSEKTIAALDKVINENDITANFNEDSIKNSILKISETTSNKNVSSKTINKNKLVNNYIDNAALNNEELKAIGWNNTFAYFDFNKADLREDAKTIIDNNLSVLQKNKNLHISIHGYTDSRGTDSYNKRLSARRSASIRSYLEKNGISSSRIISTYFLGEKNLVNNCGDDVECAEAEHQLNRRVEFKVYNKNKALTLNSE